MLGSDNKRRWAVLPGASRDPPEKQAPMCTLHSFPHNIDHCLTYARSEFEGMLEKSPTEANAFLTDPAKYLAAVRQVGVLPCTKCLLQDGSLQQARDREPLAFHVSALPYLGKALLRRACAVETLRLLSCRCMLGVRELCMHALCAFRSEVCVGLNMQASDSAAREQLEKVVEVLATERCVTFEDCIAWARRNFQVPPA